MVDTRITTAERARSSVGYQPSLSTIPVNAVSKSVDIRLRLSNAEAARLFGVSRQAFSKWLESGVPADRVPAVADLAAATDLLDRRIKRERIPAVVRRTSPLLQGRSLLEMAEAGEHAAVRAAVASMFDLRRVQP
jgi:hypothetical protein